MKRARTSGALTRALGAFIIAFTLLTVCLGAGPARAQSPVTEVETSDGTTVLTIFEDGVIEAPASEGGFLLPDGTLVDESSDLGSLNLPFSGTTSSSSDLLNLTQTGRNNASVFKIDNTSNDSSAVQAVTNGTGHAVEGRQRGTDGHAGVFDIFNSDNDRAALRAETFGGGFAAEMSAFKNATVRDNPDGNIVLMKNGSNQSGPDVLGLQAGPSNPASGVNYVSFYDGSGTSVGAIEGNGSGGVRYKTSGADYAESLPVAEGTPEPGPADLVGVRGGAVGLETKGADRLMVVTAQAAVLGNAPLNNAASEGMAEPTGRVPVAFVGQVPVKVRGRAAPGDWIIASGRSDGTARAVAPAHYRPARHGPIAGQAWSRKTTSGIGEVTVAVGLGPATPVADRLRDQQNQIDSLRGRVRALENVKERQEQIAQQVAVLEARQSGSALAGPSSFLLLAVLIGLGGFGAGILWRRQP